MRDGTDLLTVLDEDRKLVSDWEPPPPREFTIDPKLRVKTMTPTIGEVEAGE